MSEEAFTNGIIACAAAIISSLIFFISPEPIYKPVGNEIQKEKWSEIEKSFKDHLSTTLYEQYRTKTLPLKNVEDYMEDVHKEIASSYSGGSEDEKIIISKTPPHFSWMILAGISLVEWAVTLFFLVSESKIYQSICSYWDEKKRLKKELNDEQIKFLKKLSQTEGFK